MRLRGLAGCFVLVAACAALAPGPRVLRADGPAARDAEVRWDADAADVGGRVANRWGEIRRSVAARLGFDADLAGAEVVVVRGFERMRAAARAAVPEWAGGVTVGGQRIVVRADAPATSRSDLEATLRHECVHLLWARHAGPKRRMVPLWFEEGVAEVVGGSVSVAAGARLDVAVGTRALLPFEQLEHTWPERAVDADLAYQQSRRWVDVLVARAGWPALARVFARALATPPEGESPAAAFDRALREATDHPRSDWDAEWRAALEEKTGKWWLWFFGDLDGLLWAVVALVSAGLFFVVRRRRRRQIDSLPDDPVPGEPAG
jgi:hypothetical protein